MRIQFELLHNNSRCQHLIALHLILVVKYRKQLLQDEVGDFVKLKIVEIASHSEFTVEEIEVDKDHIHILLTISPTICVASYVRRIKQSTTQSLWRKFTWLRKQFWREKTFKNKASLLIHPTDAASRRTVGFLDRFDK